MKKGNFKLRGPWHAPGLLLMGTAGITAVFTSCNSKEEKNADAQTPNIVLIVADDLGYGDLSCYGATKISTPAIDEIASEGMIFRNAYASSSMCSPSRYSLMTGRYSWRTRLEYAVLKHFERPLIEKERTTIASLLKRNGYATSCIGKWHLGFEWQVNDKAPENPEETVFNAWGKLQKYIDFSKPAGEGPVERGFDYFYGMAGSNNMQPYALIENDRVTQPPSEEQKAYDHYINALKAPNWDIKTINRDLTHKTVDVIDQHFKESPDKPMFLYVPTSAIHRPCLPTFTKGSSTAGLRGDIVVELDWTVNEIVTALKENNAYDNTLLIMTSDNGPRPGDPVLWLERYEKGDYEDYHQDYFDDYKPQYVNEQGNPIWKNGWLTYDHDAAGNLLGFKADAWEGGLRVPFIVRWPGKVSPGSRNDNTICLSDLMATFAEIVGDTLRNKEGDDSYSFLSNLYDNNADQVRKSLTIASGASGAMVVISGGWKYIEAAVPGRWPETYYPDGPSKLEYQLYNLQEDEEESNNLYESNPQKVKELKNIVEKVRNNSKSETD